MRKCLIAAALAVVSSASVQAQDKPSPANDIVIGRLKLPAGFKAEIWATGVAGGRTMALSPDGKKVYVGTESIGRVYEVSDEGARRTVRVVVENLVRPAGVALKKDVLYVFAMDKVLRYDGIAASPGVQPVDVTKAFDLPSGQHSKYAAFGPDGKLYVSFSAPCNACEPPSNEYAQIRRYNADGSGKEVIARGVRNSPGFDWNPVTKLMWFVDQGREWPGEKAPSDELNVVAKPGLNFGFPYCHAQGIPDPDVRKADACRGVTRPVALLGPHTANMGIKFYNARMFPAEFRNSMFVARYGSWNRSKPNGFDVVNVKVGADGKARIKPFLTGFNEGKDSVKFWGRPAYVAQMPDGALLVSDEQVGAIYRISYERPKGAKK